MAEGSRAPGVPASQGRGMTEKFRPNYKITNRVTRALAQIERARGFLEAAVLSETWVREMGNRAFMLEAHYTTHIEGTYLSLEQAERVLEGQALAHANPDDIRELLNYKKAFELVSEYLETGGRVTEGLVREIHKRLVEGVRGDSARPGEYRTIQNYVRNSVTGETIYTPPPAHDIPIMMAELVKWLNREKEIHPVIVSGIAQFQLVHIHPFLDGNGRTSRLLSTLCLYRAGYDFKRLFTLSEYYDRNRQAFYRALQSVRESEMDMTRWLEYFVEGLTAQLSEVRKWGEEALRIEAMILRHSLSERQAKALGYLLVHGSMRINDFEKLYPEINRRTLQRDLKDMVQIGVLASEGATNKLIYRMAL